MVGVGSMTVAALMVLTCGTSPARHVGPDSVAVPLVLEGNRPPVDVTFRRLVDLPLVTP